LQESLDAVFFSICSVWEQHGNGLPPTKLRSVLLLLGTFARRLSVRAVGMHETSQMWFQGVFITLVYIYIYIYIYIYTYIYIFCGLLKIGPKERALGDRETSASAPLVPHTKGADVRKCYERIEMISS
jgi:hypothetical protein